MSEDSLKTIPVEKWDELLQILKTDWPRCITGYYILDIQRKWTQEGLDYGFKVFCPFGDVHSGMIVVHKKGDFYEIFIECPQDDTSLLAEALRETREIDWKTDICVMFAQNHIIECIKKVASDVKVDVTLSPLELYILKKGSPLFVISLPPNFSFKPLSPDSIELIDSKWPHRYPGSTSYFQVLIHKDAGYGLYNNTDLVSWVFVKETGALGHMYTLEEHRRKGYGELILKLISNFLLERDRDVFSYIIKRNVHSCKLHEKLGFEGQSGVGSCHLKMIL